MAKTFLESLDEARQTNFLEGMVVYAKTQDLTNQDEKLKQSISKFQDGKAGLELQTTDEMTKEVNASPELTAEKDFLAKESLRLRLYTNKVQQKKEKIDELYNTAAMDIAGLTTPEAQQHAIQLAKELGIKHDDLKMEMEFPVIEANYNAHQLDMNIKRLDLNKNQATGYVMSRVNDAEVATGWTPEKKAKFQTTQFTKKNHFIEAAKAYNQYRKDIIDKLGGDALVQEYFKDLNSRGLNFNANEVIELGLNNVNKATGIGNISFNQPIDAPADMSLKVAMYNRETLLMKQKDDLHSNLRADSQLYNSSPIAKLYHEERDKPGNRGTNGYVDTYKVKKAVVDRYAVEQKERGISSEQIIKDTDEFFNKFGAGGKYHRDQADYFALLKQLNGVDVYRAGGLNTVKINIKGLRPGEEYLSNIPAIPEVQDIMIFSPNDPTRHDFNYKWFQDGSNIIRQSASGDLERINDNIQQGFVNAGTAGKSNTSIWEAFSSKNRADFNNAVTKGSINILENLGILNKNNKK